MSSTNTVLWLVTLAGIFGTWLIASTALKAPPPRMTVDSGPSGVTVQVAAANW